MGLTRTSQAASRSDDLRERITEMEYKNLRDLCAYP